MKTFFGNMIVMILCTCPFATAQDDTAVLMKRVTVEVYNKPLPEILSLIEKQAAVFFAYPNEIITQQHTLSLRQKQVTIKSLLALLFPAAQFDIKVIGQQVIIKSRGKHSSDSLPAMRVVEMNTVVVTALGINREQRSLGYAYTAIKGSELTKAREINAVQLLSGRVAGLDVNPVNSGVGGAVKVTLRGVKMIGGDNQPLYVIDGVPVNNSSPGQADKYGGYDLGDGAALINPDEIASISVLKGGAASALYGSRAANGVILITTKKGCRDGLEINFTSNAVISAMHNSYDYQTTYGSGRDGLLPPDAIAARDFPQLSWGPKLNADSLVWLWNGRQVPYINAKNNLQQFFREGLTLTHAVSVAAGGERTQLRFTYTNIHNNDIIPNSGLNRHHFALRGTAQLTRQLSIDAKVAYLNEKVNNRPALSDNPNNIGYVLSGIAPNIDINWLKDYKDPVTGNYVNWNNNTYQVNPYWAINEQPNNSVQDRLNGFVQLKYQLFPTLFVQARTGTDYSRFGFREFMEYSTPFNENGSLLLRDRNFRETNTELLLHFDKQAGNCRISADAGANRMDYEEHLLNTTGLNMNVRGIKSINNFQTKNSNELAGRKRINSLYGAVNLAYKHYLYLDVTGRNDWSSTLSRAHNAYFYPSVSASFVFSELMAPHKILSFGKVRFSLAQTGTAAIDPYQLTLTYSSDPNLPRVGGYSIGGVAVDKVPFEALKPSISRSYEAGANLVFFNNRINLDVTWYRSNTRNQVLNAPLSSTSGYTSAVINSGNVLNRGIEAALGIKPFTGRAFNWDISLNFARNRNRILALSPLVSGYYKLASARWANVSIVAKEGAAYGIITGRKFLRNEQGQMILDANYLPQYDATEATLGNSQYDWTGGITQQFSYKQFSLTVLLDIKQGGNIYSMTNLLAYASGRHKGTLEGREGWQQSENERVAAGKTPDEWTATGGLLVKGVQRQDVGIGGRPIYKEVTAYVNPQIYWQRVTGNIPEPFIYDASFVKLRQLNIDYKMPATVFRNTVIKEISISLVARNLFTLSKHVPNVDPESSYNNGNAQGFEYGSLPTRRSCGINLYAKF